MAHQDGRCDVCIYTNPQAAKGHAGNGIYHSTSVKEINDANDHSAELKLIMQETLAETK